MSWGVSLVMVVGPDWRRAARAIASVWNIIDEAILSWDRRGLTWNGSPFDPATEWGVVDHLRAALGGQISYTDLRSKLRLVAGDFYWPGRDRQHLQLQQRQAVSVLARPGNWQLTLDADEEIIDPQRFREGLPPPQPGLGLTCEFRAVYKVIGETALIFDSDRHIPVAVADPGSTPKLMHEGRPQHWLPTPGLVLHHHMCGRGVADLHLKMSAISPGTYSADEVVIAWERTTLENWSEPMPRPTSSYAPMTPLRAIPLAMLRAPQGASLTAERRAL